MRNYYNIGESSAYQKIYDAITNKESFSCTYDGYLREFSPHALGLSKNGDLAALCYQYDGFSSSGKVIPNSIKNWKCIKLEKVKNCEANSDGFHSASNHSRRQTCVHVIHIEIDY